MSRAVRNVFTDAFISSGTEEVAHDFRGLTWVAGAYIKVYGKCALIRNRAQPPLAQVIKLRNQYLHSTELVATKTDRGLT